ncbi:30S ribosomal protein S1 [uncultured Campylobacter sp.]|uniref:30S ribosomal protein S1 n=1 Tax=uncultured Campylobacter sp. TaxID=218934 RepID=UPI0026289D3E|nr:30S ribosomal protein S1 [uncultured Campylobacter sp.]
MAQANGEFVDLDDYQECDFQSLLDEHDNRHSNGSVIEGIIVDIRDDVGEVCVDVGEKEEAIMPIDEIKNADTLLFKKGDKIMVALLSSSKNGRRVSYQKALRKAKVDEFIKNFKEEEDKDNIIEVELISKNNGGYIAVNSEGVEFFLPRSQYNLSKDTKNFKHKKLKVKIIKVDDKDGSIIVSRKKLSDEERKKRKELVKNIMELDNVVEGIIKKITSYGMFVDVGGVDGLVHYSEISYKGHVNPSIHYKEGEKVLVKAIGYDKDKKHLSLSIKAAMPDPWNEIKDGLEVGDTIKVVVSNIEPYGAFVDLGNDIEGFLHISEISWDKNIKHPKDYISKGDELDVEVIEIDALQKRLRVSLRNLLLKPFDEFLKKYKVGDVVKGTITSIINFGAFVKISSIEALLHNDDCSWDRNKKCKDLYKVGDEIEVKIIKIDPQNQKISLSVKDLQDSPIHFYAQKHKNNDIVKGKIKDIKDFGVFVELDDNVDALIHKDDISTKDLENLKLGDEIEAVISLIDEKKNRIRLSVKALQKMKEREVLNELNSNEKVTLGDIIKEQLS